MSETVWAAGLLCRDGSLLLARRTSRRRLYPGMWDLPGGHAEAGEDASVALCRELREELGVEPASWELLGRADVPVGEEVIDYQIFLVRAWVGEPSNRSPEEHSEVRWFSFDQAAALPLADARYRNVFARAARLTGPRVSTEPTS